MNDVSNWILLVQRVVIIASACALLTFIARYVIKWWRLLLKHERLLAAGVLALVVAPLVGVVERGVHQQDMTFADVAVFFGYLWAVFGVSVFYRHVDEEVHVCPNCGDVHPKVAIGSRVARRGDPR